ncbi:MAG: DUF4276 family protein [Magnetococcales bacterium]|nr:DUF4276 family protein [Magnetococcales bacterium]MBF0157767.1 DUF4276 family protein [Magnetococcales bacterium]
MHFEILVEDQSGQKALEILVPKIVGEEGVDGEHTFFVHSYKGLGRIPKDLKGTTDPEKRILLDRLPKLLRGYAETFRGYGKNYRAIVVVVCDLDDRALSGFLGELGQVSAACSLAPGACFCIAIEEGEAWFLGDLAAIRGAYPEAREEVLSGYVNDSICGTWERLADAIHPGGSKGLSSQGWRAIGREKSRWAERIAPRMEVEENRSPSFVHFRNKLRELAHGAP